MCFNFFHALHKAFVKFVSFIFFWPSFLWCLLFALFVERILFIIRNYNYDEIVINGATISLNNIMRKWGEICMFLLNGIWIGFLKILMLLKDKFRLMINYLGNSKCLSHSVSVQDKCDMHLGIYDLGWENQILVNLYVSTHLIVFYIKLFSQFMLN